MRFGLFDGGSTCAVRGEHIVDLEALDAAPDIWACLTDPDVRRRIDVMLRGQPPQKFVRRADNADLLAPIIPRRVVLCGGAQADFEPQAVVRPGGALPAGQWMTGVAAVVAQDVSKLPAEPLDAVAGFTAFHCVDGCVMPGPWIVDRDEVPDPLALVFSAFVDDMPRIRPSKALLDWGPRLRMAHEATPLRQGDFVALSAPAQEAAGEVRSALVQEGQVLGRLEAVLG